MSVPKPFLQPGSQGNSNYKLLLLVLSSQVEPLGPAPRCSWASPLGRFTHACHVLVLGSLLLNFSGCFPRFFFTQLTHVVLHRSLVISLCVGLDPSHVSRPHFHLV